MLEIARRIPPHTHPRYEQMAKAAEWQAEADLARREEMRKWEERVPFFILSRLDGGSGLSISQTLRHFFLEYVNRFAQYGIYEMPLSFNVMESFFCFSEKYIAFDIREEQESLLRLHDYIDWYTGGSFPDEPRALCSIMEEGRIYSYNLVSPNEDYHLTTPDSIIRIAGIGLVRHSKELSIVVVAGESPPFPSDAKASDLSGVEVVKGREGIRADPAYSIADRYLPELPGHARVILMTQLDLDAPRYNITYIHQDCGSYYTVVTDDAEALDGPDATPGIREKFAATLARYSDLVSAAFCTIYLPVYFIDRVRDIVETKFSTALGVKRRNKKIQN
jgi:hypothetical protein